MHELRMMSLEDLHTRANRLRWIYKSKSEVNKLADKPGEDGRTYKPGEDDNINDGDKQGTVNIFIKQQ